MNGAEFKLSVHAKRKWTVEVRLFVLLASGQWHRMGTLCMPSAVWYTSLRPLLRKGSVASGVVMHVDDTQVQARP